MQANEWQALRRSSSLVLVSHMEYNLLQALRQNYNDVPWTLANALEALRRSNSDRTHAAVTTQLERTNVVFDGWGIMMVYVVEQLGLDNLIG